MECHSFGNPQCYTYEAMRDSLVKKIMKNRKENIKLLYFI